MLNDRILIDREKRREEIKNITVDFDAITIKANVPGTEKNIFEATLLVNYFAKKISLLPTSFIKFLKGFDGETAYFSTSIGEDIKKKAENLEETHPLGRLIDIDVTKKGEEKSLSRKNLRKCFLCEKEAFVCGRNRTHTIGELIRFFKEETNKYFSSLIENIIEESMLFELELENKFGLVTKTSQGSHSDLNYDIMVSAIGEIKKELKKAFFVGLTSENLDNIMDKLIPIGISAEEKMKDKTLGANAYKGFIFMGGLLLFSTGYAIKNNLSEREIFSTIPKVIKDYPVPKNTFGYSVSSSFGGIIEHAKGGFSVCRDAKELIDNKAPLDILRFIVNNINDSVLLKRAGSKEKYDYYKNLIYLSKGKEKEVTDECVKNNISIGGSADVLIASYMVNKLTKTFYFKV